MTNEDIIQEYGQVLTAEPAAEYGVWATEKQMWYVLDTGEVFHTLSTAVATAQLQHVEYHCIPDKYIIRMFPSLQDGLTRFGS